MKTFRSIYTQERAALSVSAMRCDFLCRFDHTFARSHDSPFGVSQRFSNSAASACQCKATLRRHAPHTWRCMRLSLSMRERSPWVPLCLCLWLRVIVGPIRLCPHLGLLCQEGAALRCFLAFVPSSALVRRQMLLKYTFVDFQTHHHHTPPRKRRNTLSPLSFQKVFSTRNHFSPSPS